jgi:hypothetical protein
MRRLVAITAFALFLAVPLWAQRGGGHGGGGGGHAGFGGGGHAGFSGGHAGGFSGHSGFSGGHAYGGLHSGVGSSRGSNRGFNRNFSSPANRGPFLHNGTGFRNNRIGFRNNGFRNGIGFRNGYRGYGFRNKCYAYGCWGWGYPWWGYGGWWGDSDYDDDSYQDQGIANQMNQQSLDEQQMRRQEEADGDQDAYLRPPYRRRSAAGDGRAAESVLPATVLVFRDQHKEEIHNYAIIGQTLWNFSPQRTEKISLTDLDLTATTKANEERGLTFRVPVANQNPNAPPVNMQGQPPAPVVKQSSSA